MRISLSEGINVSIISIVIVFLVLFGLQLILISFKYIFKEDKTLNQENALPLAEINVLEEDEETKIVAALTALILANEDQQDKYYQVTSIKRVK
ncbi:OadG family transporter subunit [Carnobacterium sp.]|uniref:OadG family transporter subunit n=1 Tax=Carnobacterium sp. TaxID=48221 RepID=UPI003C77A7B4